MKSYNGIQQLEYHTIGHFNLPLIVRGVKVYHIMMGSVGFYTLSNLAGTTENSVVCDVVKQETFDSAID